jgi:hypothetical protein
MKLIISIIFILSSVGITVFFTIPQYNCEKSKCSYDGIKAIRTQKISYSSALDSAKNLESRKSDLTSRYNSITEEERQKLESLLPNNVDNIKLVLELETLAKRYGLVVESPKLETKIETVPASGQTIRNDSNPNLPSSYPYGTFTLDFTVRSTYSNAKLLMNDIEKNLRLIEPVSFSIKVPTLDDTNNKSKQKTYPKGVYDINIKAVIYYLKD